jgi:hypothetical protein
LADFIALRLAARQNNMVKGCGRAKTAYLMVARKQRDRQEGVKARYTLQRHPLPCSDPFPPFKPHLLSLCKRPIMPSNYDSINGLIH